MSHTQREQPASTPDAVTIATPEGDSEYAPTQPLTGDGLTITRPRGDAPHSKEPLRNAE